MKNSAVPQSTTTAPRNGYLADQLRSHSKSNNTQSTSVNAVASTCANFTDPKSMSIQFQSTTVAPSPPPSRSGSSFAITTSVERPATERNLMNTSALRISTDFPSDHLTTPQRSRSRGAISVNRKTSMGNLHGISRTPSLKAALSQSLGGTASGTSSLIPSPIIAAMGDVTPLPSPLMCGDSPGPWKMLLGGTPPKSRGRLNSVGEDSVLESSPSESSDVASTTSATKRKMYKTLEGSEPATIPTSQEHVPQHTRNRSASEYIPQTMAASIRQTNAPNSHSAETPKSQQSHMRREPNFAQSRGLTPTVTQPPTPPPSESSHSASDSNRPEHAKIELFEARGRHDRKRRRWRALKCLGQGTFSQVMLATSQIVPKDRSETQPPRKTLVAVKICEHGPKGGASEERVEMSLKRELEILQDIHHPSLVDLKAWSIEPTRAILVLTYSPGGDLFDVATAHRHVLTPQLLRRVFAELIGAVRYLHGKRIVHRDIKLENILVNLSPEELADSTVDWTMYPNSIITLTDLGLSRRITSDEKLETRCGSDDYAAPEVIMGQPYDGRATDAWSLGVLLYALLESRLPFDPHPGMSDAHRMRSRTSHRIARVEWRWVEYAGDDGDHDGDEKKFEEQGLTGAMDIAEGLLKRARSRWTLEKVAETAWVKEAIRMEGGVKFWEEVEGQVISS